eukprot:NODE_438_length_1563_cov_343.944297.p1 GENE.NODE_438_length_1563_cov_343.944297~~NODE_438_length_1563_cov_343.944297.p1  ORF type:complete len:432 (+),score=131.80 NODE_438_length_1563_cov_343.944297:118-1296(+)
MILLNACFIVVQTDLNMRSGSPSQPTLANIADRVFIAMFVAEVCLRVFTAGRRHFSTSNDSVHMNILDCCIVFSAVIEEVVSSVGKRSFNVTALRVLRFVRFLRILRISRALRLFSELRVIVMGIKGSLVSLGWCVVMLLIVMTLAGTLIMQLLVQDLASADSAEGDFIVENFGSMWKTLYTLHLSGMAGMDWGEISGPLLDITPIGGAAYLCYVVFSILCMMNIITGLFVDKATSVIACDTRYMQLQELQSQAVIFKQLTQVFMRGHDELADGLVTVEMFVESISDDRNQAYLRKLGIVIDATNAQNVFNFMDFDADGVLSLEELISALMNLSGNARQLTMVRLEERVRALQTGMSLLLEAMGARPNPDTTARRHRRNSPADGIRWAEARK